MIKLFVDSADLASMLALAPKVAGFTTNPTLMRKAGVNNYKEFATAVLKAIPDKPISFEVIADDWTTMEAQARTLAALGPNVYVKIPITNTEGKCSAALIQTLTRNGVKVNVTAITTVAQATRAVLALTDAPSGYISVFAGRIADTGIDPLPTIETVLALMREHAPRLELIWASSRELFNVVQAHKVGCHIITVTPDILAKMSMLGKDLTQLSLETVQMFYRDAQAAGYVL